jgi:hypothetical protein
MVIFSPLKDIPEQAPSRLKITRAHALALEMFLTSFESKEEDDLILAAMEIFPLLVYGKSVSLLPTYCAFLSNSTQELVQVPWIIAPFPYRLLPKKLIPLTTSTCHLASFLFIQMITDFQ